MIYFGTFKDIENVEYRVEITTDLEGEDEEILLADEPLVIDYESDNENAYKPYKCSTATIRILLNEANFDLIDAFANRVKVYIYKENKVIWCGFATPNTYSQSYEDYFDVFELECQDGVSTLQYYDYEYIPQYCEYYYEEPTVEHPYDMLNWDKGITTHNKATNFFHLVMMMNKKLGGMYKNIYVTDSIINPYTRDISILDSTFISENNFFDEDKKPMKMLKILEEICRYCSLTCVAYGQNLYFLNYDAIAQGINTYFAYSRVSDTKYTSSKVVLNSDHKIIIDTFSSKGCKINVDSVYNYAAVKDDLYSIESLVPSIDSDEFRVRPNWVDGESGISSLDTAIQNGDEISATNNRFVYVETDEDRANYGEVHIKNERNGKNWVYLRYRGYDWTKDLNNRFIFYYYKGDNQDYHIRENNPIQIYDSNYVDEQGNNKYKGFNWTTTYNRNGACIVDYAVIPVDSWDDIVRSVNYETAIMFHTTDTTDKDFERTGTVNISDWVNGAVQPMMKVCLEPQLMKKNDYIVISGEMANFHYFDKLPIDEGMSENTIGGQTYNFDSLWVGQWASLKCGRYYWNGEQWVEDTSSARKVFTLPFEYKKDQKAFNNFIPIRNTASYDMRLDAEGYCVPCLPYNRYEDEEGEINTIEFTLYRPHSFCYTSKRISLLKNFDIKIVGQKDDIINDDIENTKIESVKPSSNVSEYDDTNCKICTWDKKVFNWSQTFFIRYYKWNDTLKRFFQGGLSFIDDDATVQIGQTDDYRKTITELLGNTLLSPAFVFKSVDVLYDSAKGYVLKPEELIISHNVEQYDNPTLNLTVNQNIGEIKPYTKFIYKTQFPKFIFAVDKISYNLSENEATIKLINKKIEYEE